MFFILSKTISFLVMPSTLIWMSLLASAVIRNTQWKKRLFWIGLCLLFFFSNDFIVNEVMRAWQVDAKPFSAIKPRKLAIVLTGSTIPLLEPSDRVYFSRGADRVTHTVQLYKLGLVTKILVTGGNGRLTDIGTQEADEFKSAMVMMGVPADSILTESKTRNTHESAVAVAEILHERGYNPNDCLLITSSYHMRRTVACYRKVGLDIENFSTDFYAHPRNFYLSTLIIPSIDSVAVWNTLVREWLGIAAYKVAGYI